MIGIIDYKDGLVKSAPDKQIPNEYLHTLTGSSYCDHCKKTVMRNKIAFIENDNTHEIKKIGGQCIKYYLGFDYEKVLGYLEQLTELLGEQFFDDDFMGGGSRGIIEMTYSASDIIKLYTNIVETSGSHMSKKTAIEINGNLLNDRADYELDPSEQKRLKKSTGEIVLDMYVEMMNPPREEDYNKHSRYSFQSDLEAWQKKANDVDSRIKSVSDDKCNEVISFMKEKTQESNFMLNAYNKANEEFIKPDMAKYIIGACSFYFGMKMAEKRKEESNNRRQEELAKKQETSTYIGTIGEKVKFVNIEIKRIHTYDSGFGMSNIYNMEDENGSVIIKFGTINNKFLVSGEDVVVGSKLSFTADIKEHKDYNGVKQTIIGRLSKI